MNSPLTIRFILYMFLYVFRRPALNQNSKLLRLCPGHSLKRNNHLTSLVYKAIDDHLIISFPAKPVLIPQVSPIMQNGSDYKYNTILKILSGKIVIGVQSYKEMLVLFYRTVLPIDVPLGFEDNFPPSSVSLRISFLSQFI